MQQENNALKLQISQRSSNQEVQTLTSKMASLDREQPFLKSKVDEVVKENKNLLQHSGLGNIKLLFNNIKIYLILNMLMICFNSKFQE